MAAIPMTLVKMLDSQDISDEILGGGNPREEVSNIAGGNDSIQFDYLDLDFDMDKGIGVDYEKEYNINLKKEENRFHLGHNIGIILKNLYVTFIICKKVDVNILIEK